MAYNVTQTQLTTLSTEVNDLASSYKMPAVVRYDFAGGVAPDVPPIPTVPAAPTFTGALLTAGTGGTYATLTAAIAAASPGDRIQILPGTITEAAAIVINKSVEIFGTGSTCIVRRDSTTQVLSITSADVYIHDIRVWNNQLASGDPSGLSSCITAATMQSGTPSGLTGIYIASCLFTLPKMGVSIDAASWVVRDCTFESNSATPGSTVRMMAPYGSTGSSFIYGNTFASPTEAGRVICIAINSAGPRGATYTTGYTGTFVVENNTLTGSTPRAYLDTTGMFRQPGNASDPVLTGQFSFYLKGNNFAINYTSSPALFFAPAAVQPLSFFANFAAVNNSFGARTTTGQKGALFFTGASTSKILGAPTTGFYAAGNTISPATLPDGNNVEFTTTARLGVIDQTIYNLPSPLITPVAPTPGGAIVPSGLGTVDGVSLADGDRVFVVDAYDAINSGIYNAASGDWPRAVDYADGANVSGAIFVVESGATYANTPWICTNAPGAATVGTDALNYEALAVTSVSAVAPLASTGSQTPTISLLYGLSGAGGAAFGGYVAVSAAHTLSATEYVAQCIGGPYTVTLPTAVGITGRIYTLKNTDAGTITLSTTSGQAFDTGGTTIALASGELATVMSTGAGWLRLA